jgi:hypothetical protein
LKGENEMKKLVTICFVVLMFVMVGLAQADIISDSGLDTSFEDMEGWWVGGAGYGTTEVYYGQTNSDAHTGDYSVRMGIDLGDSGGWAVAVADSVSADDATDYTFSAYVKNLLGTQGALMFKAEYDGDPYYSSGELFKTIPVSGSWQLIEWEFTTPGDVTTMVPIFGINEVPDIDSDVLVDDVSLVLTPSEPPVIRHAGNTSASDFNAVIVVFDQSLDPCTSQDTDNYKVSNVEPTQATLSGEADNCVYLTTYQTMEPGETYQVSCKDVENTTGQSDPCWQSSNNFTFQNIETETYEIMLAQFPNGAYNMRFDGVGRTEWEEGDNIWISPYMASFAAQALILANRLSPDPNLLESVDDYLYWYATNMNENGTMYDWEGEYPDFESTEDMDSTDSYASEFILTSLMYYEDTQDDDFLDWVWPYIIKAAGAIDLTLEDDDLTWAKPSYHVKYLMDNSEVWQGYSAAALLAEYKEDSARQTAWQDKADDVLAALDNELYLGSTLSRYAMAKHDNDSLDTTFDEASPDGLAQCLMIRNVLSETNVSRAEAVWEKTKQQFLPNGVPYEHDTAPDIIVPTWWVMAAGIAGDGDSVYRDICYAKIQQRYQILPYIELMATHIFAIYQEAVAADTDAPTPNPATFATAPYATGPYSIAMVATTGSDAVGPVRYYFDETSGNPGGDDSGWQISPSYTDTGLSASTQYTYTVQMRDSIPNTGTASSPANATTDAPPDTDPPTPNPATFATAPYATGSDSIAMVATTGSDASGPVQYYFDETSGNPGGDDSDWQPSPSYTDTGLSASTLYTYTVQMRDSVPNTGTASSPANATTDPEELLTNAGFESNFTDWATWGDAVINTSDAHTGGKSAELGGTNLGGAYQTPINGSAGTTYQISSWVKGSGGTAELKIEFYDSGDELLYEDQYVFYPTGSWAYYSTSYEAPTNTSYITATIVGRAGTEVLFDDVSFIVKEAPETVFSDNFESSTDWTNNWSAYGAWNRVTARKYDGSYSAEIDGDVTDSALVSVSIDVSGKSSATITFQWFIETGLDTGEYLAFDTNVGSGWVQQVNRQGNVDTENVWAGEEIIDVDVSGTSSMQIRFRGKMNKSNEDAYVDVVEVTAE